MAKSVRLFAVRVLSCSGSGSTSGVIAGVDWVTANRINPAVANMSLGGGVSTALDNAVRNSIASGVTYAIAAGNANTNASTSSPARVAEAITVGSALEPILDRRSRISGASLISMHQVRPFFRRIYEQHCHRDPERHVNGSATRRGGCGQNSAELAGRFTSDGAE